MRYTYECDVLGTGRGGPVLASTHAEALAIARARYACAGRRVRVANITVPPGHDDGGERTYAGGVPTQDKAGRWQVPRPVLRGRA